MRKGTIGIILGVLCILGALGLTTYNILDTLRAKQASKSVMNLLQDQIPEEVPLPDKYGMLMDGQNLDEIRYPDYYLDPTRALPVVEINNVKYIGVIEIPVLELSLPVTSEWDYDNLKIAACRYEGSPYLDDFIICAHNYETHFGTIRNLEIGDEVYFTDMDGNRFTYIVVERETLQSTDIAEMSSGEWDLTLFTCTIGGTTRVTIRCEHINGQ